MSGVAELYDLSTPAPLRLDAARRLETQREPLAEQMRIHVRRLLRVRTEASVGAADVARVRQFAGFAGGKAWWYSGGSKEDPGGRSVLLGCSPDLVYAAIDRTLGGTGQAKATGKPPTTIEFELGMRFLRDIFAGLARALELPPLQLLLAPAKPLNEPPLTFMPDLEEPFARIPWKVKLFDQEHELLLCVSHRLLQRAEPKPELVARTSDEIAPSVANAPLELLVELARCRLTLNEAAALAPGDVVLFELPPGESIEVRVQGKPRFRAKLGTHEGRYAISVTQVLEPEVAATSTAPTATTAPANALARKDDVPAKDPPQSKAATASAARPAVAPARAKPRGTS
ncbi:MAG: hypothetical protein EXS13_07085 [Planctomycetes bacterium]|nr:hypothetical protein [Planctomycetota bacterium]